MLLRIDELGPTPPQELAARLELSEADLYPHLQILCEKELITGSDEHAQLAVRPETRGARQLKVARSVLSLSPSRPRVPLAR